MKTYEGWVIYKEYYKVRVEADSWEEAKDSIWDVDISGRKPDDTDWDMYDLEEVKDETNG